LERKTKRVLSIAGILVLVLLCVIGGWFLHYRRTPAYSLGLAAEAVQQHDWERFGNFVDTKAVLGKLYDDSTAMALETVKINPSLSGITGPLTKALKPQVVDALEGVLRSYVETGERAIPGGSGGDSTLLNPIPFRVMTGLMGVSQVLRTEYSDSGAYVTVPVHDGRLDRDLEVVLRMEPQQDGSWRVVAWENMKEYVEQWDAAEKEILATLNAPSQQAIDKIWTLENVNGAVEGNGFARQLHFRIEGSLKSERPLVGIEGIVTTRTPDGQAVLSSFAETLGSVTHHHIQLDMARELNPFIGPEAAVMEAGKLRWSVTITALRFADGTALEIRRSLD
jgi:hypothetical protein